MECFFSTQCKHFIMVYSSAMSIVSSKGDKSAGGAKVIDKVICTSTKTDEEMQHWIESYKAKHSKFDILHDSSFHFCNAFVKFVSEGSTDLKKLFQNQCESDEGAPEQECWAGNRRNYFFDPTCFWGGHSMGCHVFFSGLSLLR